MTRGRDANHAYVVTQENERARDVLTRALGRDWIDQPALSHRDHLEAHRETRLEPPPEPGAPDELDKLIEYANQMRIQRQARRIVRTDPGLSPF